MKALSFKEPWLNSTLEKLLGLSVSTKRAVIRALEKSMGPSEDHPEKEKEEQREKSERFWSSFGSWEGDGTAEELAASIRNARTESPDRESMD
jgi:hypothetical protein